MWATSVILFQNTFAEATAITKDNPAFSMVNDSDDDEVFYDESRRPLNAGNDDSD